MIYDDKKERTFADFIRNASDEEKRAVYEEVMKRASERQQHKYGAGKVIDAEPSSTVAPPPEPDDKKFLDGLLSKPVDAIHPREVHRLLWLAVAMQEQRARAEPSARVAPQGPILSGIQDASDTEASAGSACRKAGLDEAIERFCADYGADRARVRALLGLAEAH